MVSQSVQDDWMHEYNYHYARGELAFVKKGISRCDDLVDRLELFIEVTKEKTAHSKKLVDATVSLIQKMQCNLESDCLVINWMLGKYIVFTVYTDINESYIYGVLKGFDYAHTPDEVWLEAWGRPRG